MMNPPISFVGLDSKYALRRVDYSIEISDL
jgi:hypothetical protein